MKALFLFLVLSMYSFELLPQEKFSVDVFMDPSMAVMNDDYGNDGFTPNLLMNVSVQLGQREYGYFSVGQSLEYADLYGGEYFRYSIIQLGYTINQFSFSDRLETTFAVNYGITKRWSKGYTNFGCTVDISYCINPNIKLTSLIQLVERTDIMNPMKRDPIVKPSVFVGLKFNLFDVRPL